MTTIPADDHAYVELPGRQSADPLARVAAASSLRVVRLESTPGRRAHRHPMTEEVVFVRAGRGHVWIDGTLHPVGSGDVIHVPTGAAHATLPEPGTTMELVCFFPHPDLKENIEELDITVSDG